MYVEKVNLFTKYSKDYLPHLLELNKVVKAEKEDSPHGINFTAFRDDMIARKVHGLPVPEHLRDLTERSDRLANIELSSMVEYGLFFFFIRTI
jgi:hypothetical protein